MNFVRNEISAMERFSSVTYQHSSSRMNATYQQFVPKRGDLPIHRRGFMQRKPARGRKKCWFSLHLKFVCSLCLCLVCVRGLCGLVFFVLGFWGFFWSFWGIMGSESPSFSTVAWLALQVSYQYVIHAELGVSHGEHRLAFACMRHWFSRFL